MFRRRRTDLTPTFGIAITALTAYLVYTSLRLDRLIQNAGAAKAAQIEKDINAAEDRQDLRDRGDRRSRRITWALSVIAIAVAALAIKGVTSALFG